MLLLVYDHVRRRLLLTVQHRERVLLTLVGLEQRGTVTRHEHVIEIRASIVSSSVDLRLFDDVPALRRTVRFIRHQSPRRAGLLLP